MSSFDVSDLFQMCKKYGVDMSVRYQPEEWCYVIRICGPTEVVTKRIHSDILAAMEQDANTIFSGMIRGMLKELGIEVSEC